jgi:hypothetical protein
MDQPNSSPPPISLTAILKVYFPFLVPPEKPAAESGPAVFEFVGRSDVRET